MTDKQEKALYIARQLLDAGMTLSGASGVIANIEAESAFKSTNVQDSYERGLCMNDEQYTTAVDNGTYTRFTVDQAGYGICQWTANDRKKGMLNFHRTRGKSIGDFYTQVDWMRQEIKSYPRAYTTCRENTDPYTCGYVVCKHYEIPENTEAAAQYRGGLAQEWYVWLKANLEPVPEPEPTPEPKPAAAPASVILLQLAMERDGYWHAPVDGVKTPEFRTQIVKYAADVAGC